MINYTKRLDKAIKVSAWAHEQQKQHRKGTDIPYIIHPFSVMMIAGNVTDDEDTLIGCLLHDILEDVDTAIYSEEDMREDFGKKVLEIVQGVSKDDSIEDWKQRSDSYLENLTKARPESLIVCAADKIHNLKSMLIDYENIQDELWDKFSSDKKSQLWWYESSLEIIRDRAPENELVVELQDLVDQLRRIIDC